MEIRHVPKRPPFYAATCGAGIETGSDCDHGHPAFVLHFIGSWAPNAQQTGNDFEAILSRCNTAQLLGTLAALVTHHDGHLAGEEFMDATRTAFHAALGQLGANRTHDQDRGAGRG